MVAADRVDDNVTGGFASATRKDRLVERAADGRRRDGTGTPAGLMEQEQHTQPPGGAAPLDRLAAAASTARGHDNEHEPAGRIDATPAGTPVGRRWPSRQMRAVTRVLLTEPKLMASAEAFRATHEGRVYPQPAPVTAGLRVAASTTRRDVDGFAVFTVTPKGTRRDPELGRSDWHILYLHGGGYCDQLLSIHWEIVLSLIRYTGARITVPAYPLAPEHTHDTGHEFVERVYRELLDEVPPERIVLMGDSAGGGMCLAQAMRYRDAWLPLPARLILFAPWVNAQVTNPEMALVEALDPILSRPGVELAGRWWAGADDVTHPQVSPLFGDVGGLPPVDIFTGTADLLTPDIRLLADKLRAAGTEVSLVEYAGAIHVYVGATFTPEARDTYRRIAHTLGTSNLRARVSTAVITLPGALLGRELTFRARERGTPWIQHVGARARLHLDRRSGRLPGEGPPR